MEKLESFYEDPVWKQDKRMQFVNAWTLRLWKIAAFTALCLVIFTTATIINEDMMTIGKNILGVSFGLGILLIPSSILALLFGLIRFKKIPYSERVFFLTPIMFILFEIAVIILYTFFRSYI